MKNLKKSTLAAAVGSATLALAMSAPVQAESSVDISGWINEGVMYWDDGVDSDISQQSDNGTTLGSRITFSGTTDLQNTGMNAGFEVILEPISNTTPLIFGNQQNMPDNNAYDVGVLGSSVNVGGAFGKVTVGLQSMPTDNIAVLADPSATLWPSISPVFRGNGFMIQDTDAVSVTAGGLNGGDPFATTWGNFLGCLTAPTLQGAGGIGLDCNGIYRSGVRYDLPTFVDGLNLAVGASNDDMYDVAAKYNTELAGRITTMLHLGYAHNGGPNGGLASQVFYNSADNFQVQLGLMDQQTGIFGTFAYQYEDASLTDLGRSINYEDSTDAYWGKIGIKKKFNAVGDTSFAVQYGSYNDQYGPLGAVGVTGSEVERLGIEVSQYFGSNLMLYGVWENLSLDVDGSSAAAQSLDNGDDLDTFTLGLTYFF
ncbi:hypothetical protein J2T55_000582 [Methylohalomonas lacus]|uniref:Porin domain-containing protein n=1 Tax=Methylohalomonas lacus TaxID=398773 RepID=A0AAE3HLE8_9GAMM|nr:porin [Methylohalomonas lacus]MCS3902578.1 hypothetical protein [Methylohalomonas lacus]